jgi:Radical SAM superfamily
MIETGERIRQLVVVLVEVTKYDREGYLIQFHKGVLPCNTLAAMWSLTEAAFTSSQLAGLLCRVIAFNERTTRGGVNALRIMKEHSTRDTRVVVGLVGIQTNMFPRARQLALEFKAQGATVVMGGFHISGSITMLHDGNGDSKIPCPRVMPPECAELMEQGVILFHGEAEGIWHEVLGDIVRGEAKPLYRGGRPALVTAPLPEYPPDYFKGFFGRMHTLDTGRGCPFTCSFCTIINVQGHDPRYRSVEAIVNRVRRATSEERNPFFFFTDDNFARNPHWKNILAGLMQLRAEGLEFTFMVEADLVAWKIPQFVELLAEAGCSEVFMGVETVGAQAPEQGQGLRRHVRAVS